MHIRLLIGLGLVGFGILLGQGVSSRGVRPQPRGKPSGVPFLAKFTDVAAESGLREATVYGAVEKMTYLVETSGGGVAFLDYDNDGWQDLFVVSGTRFDGSGKGATNRLYRNLRNGKFVDVTASAGLVAEGWGMSVATGDVDNDGWQDLIVTYWGESLLYRNQRGVFIKVEGIHRQRDRPYWDSGATFIDFDNDGDLDLLIANYVDFDPARTPRPGQSANCNWKGVAVVCGPRGLPAGRLWFYENKGGWRFEECSDRVGIGKIRGTYAMTAVAADLDHDGWTDVYIAGDSSPSLFLRNTGKGTFVEEGLERGIALNDDGMEQAGMGVGLGDVNLDGFLDLFKTHFSDDTNVLYRNDGKGNFRDDTISSGLGVETRFVGWGAGIHDLDNDGLPDLFFVTGSVYMETEAKLPAYPYKTPRVVFRNLGGGRMEQLIAEAGSGVAAAHSSRGAAFGDYDNDGDIDVLVLNKNEPPSLLRNDLAADRNWLKVRLVGVKSNRSAVGARVVVSYEGKKQGQAVTSQASFYSANDNRLHFGVGTEKKVEVAVYWPGGGVQQFTEVPVNRLVVIREGAAQIEEQQLSAPNGVVRAQ